MKYEDIKNYAARCDSHPDHQTGIITHQMIMDRLHDEIEELRDYIEAKSKPLTDHELAHIYTAWDKTPGLSMADFARAIEQAHGIGGKE